MFVIIKVTVTCILVIIWQFADCELYTSSGFRSVCNVKDYFSRYFVKHHVCKRRRELKSDSKTELKDFCDSILAQVNDSLTTDLLDKFPIDKESKNYVREVPGAVFSVVFPEPFIIKPRLLTTSTTALRNVLDLADADSTCEWFLDFVSGSESPLIKKPLAHRYGGHQFGEWAGQLGDGRAVLVGEYVNKKHERWELQQKGSGKTPYSRQGDGRAVLRSSVREFLASEAMHSLGIPTSRAISLVMSEDTVTRDQFYDGNIIQEKGAIVLRAAKSWFRIGSLEILHKNGEFDNVRKIADFMIEHFYPDLLRNHLTKYTDLFGKILNETASMIAHWMGVGFSHGVCNTDNFSLLSITIDYGPFGFMEAFNPDFIPNTSDDTGLYRYSNQPNVGFFNLQKLMEAMTSLIDITRAKKILRTYPDIYQERYMQIFSQKLGLLGREKDDTMLVDSFLWLMSETGADFTMTFRELGELTVEEMGGNSLPKGSWALRKVSKHQHWKGWLKKYRNRLERNSDDTEVDRRKRMHSINPRYILRNYMAQVAIGKAEDGDYSEISKILTVLSNPYTKQREAEKAGYASEPPYWSKFLKVSCSS